MVLDHGMASGFHGYGSAVQVPIHEHVTPVVSRMAYERTIDDVLIRKKNS